IIGYFSDKTWTRLGRRRPFFLGGALVAAAALALMPNASVLTLLIPPLLIGAGMLMIMDVAFNVSMEPFRALVADNLPKEQHGYGYAVQTFLIGAGAIIGSFLPYVLSEYLGVSKVAEQGHVPDNVIWSFYAGAIVLVLSLLWTVITTKEYSAEELRSFDEHADDEEQHAHSFGSIFKDFKNMPTAMKQLGLVQFFSWFALFSMWVFTTPAIAQHIYHLPASDTSSSAYADAGNLTGVLFGEYNLVATIFGLILPKLYQSIGKKKTHMFALGISGIGLISILFIQNPNLLYIPMVAVGIAWASILATPYSILSGVVPAKKMGLYMGLFNFFITLPQLVNGVLGTVLVKYVFQHQAIYCLTMAGVFMIFAAISTLTVKGD